MNNPNMEIVIGIIGGGQLGKMMAQSAKQSGYRVIILDPQEDCPASQVADRHIVAPYHQQSALEDLNRLCTVVTYEFENVDCDTIEQAIDTDKFPQGIQTLTVTQNRIAEKNFLKEHGIPVGEYRPIYQISDLAGALNDIGFPAVLKTTRFGYDGKGQVVIRSAEDLTDAENLVARSECILEAWVPFEKEVSIMISRNQHGEMSVFPASENIHHQNILHLSIVPARISSVLQQNIQRIALQIADALNLIGTLSVECFVTSDEQVYINELAPRPHNSGHYSIEACNFSQFDVSIQSVLNLPMPKITLSSPVVMVNVLGQHVEKVFKYKQQNATWHFHDYGKLEVKENRKMGHITILTNDIEETLLEIENTTIWRDTKI